MPNVIVSIKFNLIQLTTKRTHGLVNSKTIFSFIYRLIYYIERLKIGDNILNKTLMNESEIIAIYTCKVFMFKKRSIGIITKINTSNFQKKILLLWRNRTHKHVYIARRTNVILLFSFYIFENKIIIFLQYKQFCSVFIKNVHIKLSVFDLYKMI